MLKRKLQDLTVCCSYHIDFLHQKAHSGKEFRRQYVVLEEISRGGFGIVYSAIRISDNLPVAVKFVEHKHVREWTLTCNQLIPSEVCHLETCRDVPGVIRLIDWFANSKGFLIVMERPENCMDIFDLISTYGKLDEDSARGIFVQVVDSVCAMYLKHGLIHRDIKDENLIVNMKTGEVKIVDFGAAVPSEKAMRKEFQGTRSYCPPEWFCQLQYLPLEATSWSLGVLLFILVTGQLPFKNEIQICLGRVKFPSYVSKECRQLIKSCLTTSAGSRAALSTIREHPWLNKKMPVHMETFEAVLDKTLGKAQERTSRTPAEERRRTVEEENQINNIILAEDELSGRKYCATGDAMHSRHASRVVPTVEATDEIMCSLAPRTRLNSRYDNISCSSHADYVSLMSVDVVSSQRTSMQSDSTSLATTATANIYYSTYDISAEDEDERTVIAVKEPMKSVSAYNLPACDGKRSMNFKSFDQELDTVPERATPEHSPRLMTSSTGSDDQTVVLENTTNALTTKATNSRPTRISRHRPLRVVPNAPTLSIFEVSPRPSLTKVV